MTYFYDTVFQAPPLPLGQALGVVEQALQRWGYWLTPVSRIVEDEVAESVGPDRLEVVDAWESASTQLTGDAHHGELYIDVRLRRNEVSLYFAASISDRMLWWLRNERGPEVVVEEYRSRMLAIASAIESRVACGNFELTLPDVQAPDLFQVLLRNPEHGGEPCDWGLVARSELTEERRAAHAARGLEGTDLGAFCWFQLPNGSFMTQFGRTSSEQASGDRPVWLYDVRDDKHRFHVGSMSTAEGLSLLDPSARIEVRRFGGWRDLDATEWLTPERLPALATVGALRRFLVGSSEIDLIDCEVRVEGFGTLGSHDDGECTFESSDLAALRSVMAKALPTEPADLAAILLASPGTYVALDAAGAVERFVSFDDFLASLES